MDVYCVTVYSAYTVPDCVKCKLEAKSLVVIHTHCFKVTLLGHILTYQCKFNCIVVIHHFWLAPQDTIARSTCSQQPPQLPILSHVTVKSGYLYLVSESWRRLNGAGRSRTGAFVAVNVSLWDLKSSRTARKTLDKKKCGYLICFVCPVPDSKVSHWLW